MKEAFKMISKEVSKEPIFKNINLPGETIEILLQDFYETHESFDGFIKELKSIIKSFGREIVIQEANKIKEQNKKKEFKEIRKTLKGFAEALEKN
jgi:N-methylhydantoinase B/oxoprolinase/acetone carboxylase alpha subunit